MIQQIDFASALKLSDPLFIDVRSESEFEEDHIPTAVNIPIFNDEERKHVGTVFKHNGPEEAKKLGLTIVSPKLPHLVNLIEEAGMGKEIVLYCWRGGMRSKSLATILDLMNINVFRLNGGYKKYRQWINNYFQQDFFPFEVVVLHGLTGTGKTNIIRKLADQGASAVDLEGLANNRGSVFGNVGLSSQPSQKLFESLLWFQLHKYGQKEYIIVECESKRIGKVTLPPSLYSGMKNGKHILLFDSLDHRIERILTEYKADLYANDLIHALDKLKNRLGNEKVLSLHQMIECGSFHPVVETLLVSYYDPLYNYPNHPSSEFDLNVNSFDENQGTKEIVEYLS